jgi:N-acetylglucosamine PTS system EIIB component
VTTDDAVVNPHPGPQEDSVSKASDIVAGLGGAANIVEIEACITRLRTEVNDPSAVDQAALKRTGAHGVLVAGQIVQVVVGPEADSLADDIQDLL